MVVDSISFLIIVELLRVIRSDFQVQGSKEGEGRFRTPPILRDNS